jgi:hypothetical protein
MIMIHLTLNSNGTLISCERKILINLGLRICLLKSTLIFPIYLNT